MNTPMRELMLAARLRLAFTQRKRDITLVTQNNAKTIITADMVAITVAMDTMTAGTAAENPKGTGCFPMAEGIGSLPS